MKKQYLVTREQLDRAIDNYLTLKMKDSKVVIRQNKYSDTTFLNAFIDSKGDVIFILIQYGDQTLNGVTVQEGMNSLKIDESLVAFFTTHLGVRKHKAVDIISDWFQETYDFDFEEVEVYDNLKSILRGWS